MEKGTSVRADESDEAGFVVAGILISDPIMKKYLIVYIFLLMILSFWLGSIYARMRYAYGVVHTIGISVDLTKVDPGDPGIALMLLREGSRRIDSSRENVFLKMMSDFIEYRNPAYKSSREAASSYVKSLHFESLEDILRRKYGKDVGIKINVR
ncbi:MAG: hypothetical protein QM680_09450 [Luteolibacter sp.]